MIFPSTLETMHEAAFLRMMADYDAHDPGNGSYYEMGRRDFASYVKSLKDEEQGTNLPDGYVPCSHRWLFQDNEVTGIVRIRHHIDTPFLRDEAGHIGYDVPPSMRGHGYGVRCLKAGLEAAATLGIPDVLVCANTDNPASWKIIERCGGVLEVERLSKHYQLMVRYYWIDVTATLGSQ